MILDILWIGKTKTKAGDTTQHLVSISSISENGDVVENQSSDILQHSQIRPTGDRWLKF